MAKENREMTVKLPEMKVLIFRIRKSTNMIWPDLVKQSMVVVITILLLLVDQNSSYDPQAYKDKLLARVFQNCDNILWLYIHLDFYT